MPELPIHHEKASKYAWLKRRAPEVIAAYRSAQTRGQFLESLFAIHTLIEDALSCRFSEEEGRELTLLEMAERRPAVEWEASRVGPGWMDETECQKVRSLQLSVFPRVMFPTMPPYGPI